MGGRGGVAGGSVGVAVGAAWMPAMLGTNRKQSPNIQTREGRWGWRRAGDKEYHDGVVVGWVWAVKAVVLGKTWLGGSRITE